VKEEIKKKGISDESVVKLMEILATKGSNFEKLEKLKALVDNRAAADGIKEMEDLLSYLDESNIVFDLSLARGLSYYTGTVYEVFVKDSEMQSAVAAGGRWDKMIGDYLGSGKEFPAVGISFGIEPITECIKLASKKKKETVRKSPSKAYIIPIQTVNESMKIAEELRSCGIKTDIDIMGRGISKNLQYANALGIPNVLFIGEDELKKKKIKLRNMESGEEEMLSVKEICKKLRQ